MAKEIDPNNERQMKANNVVKIIHGGDKQEYQVTDKHPLIKGTKEVQADLSVKVGQKRWAHPHLVERWVKAGWVKETETQIKKVTMPQPAED